MARSCGDCKLCCKLLSVPEIDKPQHTWCEHCAIKSPDRGCSIYYDRPDACATFQCWWLQSHLPEGFKPNKVKCVVWYQEKTELGPVVMISEDIEGQHMKNRLMRRFVESALQRGNLIVVIRPDGRRSILGNSEHHANIQKEMTDKLMEKDISFRLEEF